MKHLAILGASGHGKVVADIAECQGWEQVSFFDDAWPKKLENGAWSVVGDSYLLLQRLSDFSGVAVAIGDNTVRLNKLNMFKQAGAPLPALVHPSAVVSRYSFIDDAVVIVAGAVINADARVRFGTVINTSASVGHDCDLGEGCHICPGVRLAGGVEVGSCSWVGVGTSVRQLVKIGSNVVIGAGAAVVSDIENGAIAVGVPARIVRPDNQR